MPDTVDNPDRAPYDRGLDARVSRLETEVDDISGRLGGLEKAVGRVEATLPYLATEAAVARIEAMLAATLPHLVTKAELAELRADLAEKPGKTYLWAVLSVLVTATLGAFGAGLAAVAILH